MGINCNEKMSSFKGYLGRAFFNFIPIPFGRQLARKSGESYCPQ
jgi:hypothetical protein